MTFEEGISKTISKLPDILQALLFAVLVTAAGYIFIYFAKFLQTLPGSFDLPWIAVFVIVFLLILVWKRIKIIRQDRQPQLK
ncbi:MAG: hypothetical protein QXN71_04085 [Candidatus Aenigmatarchaeota archaeon]